MENNKDNNKDNNIDDNMEVDCETFKMPPVEEVVAERAREAAIMKKLADMDAATAAREAEEADLEAEEAALEAAEAARPRPDYLLLDKLTGLADSLRPAHNVDFLDEYIQQMVTRPVCEVQGITDELIRSVENLLENDEPLLEVGGSGVVVLASWLCSLAPCRKPYTVDALPSLFAVLLQLTDPQMKELAIAMHAALKADQLLEARDILDGVGRGLLSALLLRATLARLTNMEPAWHFGELTPIEVYEVLVPRYKDLDWPSMLVALMVAARVMDQAGPAEKHALLKMLVPPRPEPRWECLNYQYVKVRAYYHQMRCMHADMFGILNVYKRKAT